MDDLISRKELLNRTIYNPLHSPYITERDVLDCPSAQPETAKRIVGKSSRGVTMWYQCDMCKEPVDKEDAFCPGCGRRLLDE